MKGRRESDHTILGTCFTPPINEQCLKVTPSHLGDIDVYAARNPLARPKHGQFGPAQARPDPVQSVPGLARPAPRARAWAVTPARGLARPGTELAGRPGSGPLTPTIEPNRPAHSPRAPPVAQSPTPNPPYTRSRTLAPIFPLGRRLPTFAACPPPHRSSAPSPRRRGGPLRPALPRPVMDGSTPPPPASALGSGSRSVNTRLSPSAATLSGQRAPPSPVWRRRPLLSDLRRSSTPLRPPAAGAPLLSDLHRRCGSP